MSFYQTFLVATVILYR